MTRSLAKSEVIWATLCAIIFAVCFGYPILAHLSRGDISSYPQSDWDYFLQLRWVPFYTITHFHQFPLWNPYKCGGMPIFGNPQSAVLTPFLLLDLMFGPVIGARLQIVAHIAIGFSGAYVLARGLGISKLGAIACAGAFAGSSWFYLRAEVGHLTFMTGAYAPWAIALLQVSSMRRRLAPAALGGLVMALMLFEGGGAHLFLQVALLLALLSSMFALQQRTLFPLLALAIIGAFTLGFTAIEVLPALAYAGPRTITPDEFSGLGLLFQSFMSRDQSPNAGFYEHGAYIGVLVLALALLGSILRFQRSFPWIVLFFVVLLLAAGDFSSYSPWVLTHKLPFYDSLRQPYRWLILLPLAAAVLAGFGIDAIRATSKRWGTIAAAVLVGLALVDDWLVATPYLHLIVEGVEAAPLPWSTSFRQIVDNRYGLRMFTAAQANIGVASCYEGWGIMPNSKARGYNQPDYLGEEYLLGQGSVRLSHWTPNKLSFEVESAAPSTMIVNQNYDPGWRVIEGKGSIGPTDAVDTRNALIAVTVPAGKQHLVLAYRSERFLVGLLIALGSLSAMILLWSFERGYRLPWLGRRPINGQS